MKNVQTLTKRGVALALLLFASACVVAPREGYREGERDNPREGYYDRDHHRYYHQHGWHECTDGGEYCR